MNASPDPDLARLQAALEAARRHLAGLGEDADGRARNDAKARIMALEYQVEARAQVVAKMMAAQAKAEPARPVDPNPDLLRRIAELEAQVVKALEQKAEAERRLAETPRRMEAELARAREDGMAQARQEAEAARQVQARALEALSARLAEREAESTQHQEKLAEAEKRAATLERQLSEILAQARRERADFQEKLARSARPKAAEPDPDTDLAEELRVARHKIELLKDALAGAKARARMAGPLPGPGEEDGRFRDAKRAFARAFHPDLGGKDDPAKARLFAEFWPVLEGIEGEG